MSIEPQMEQIRNAITVTPKETLGEIAKSNKGIEALINQVVKCSSSLKKDQVEHWKARDLVSMVNKNFKGSHFKTIDDVAKNFLFSVKVDKSIEEKGLAAREARREATELEARGLAAQRARRRKI